MFLSGKPCVKNVLCCTTLRTHAASLAVAFYVYLKASREHGAGPGSGNRYFTVEGYVNLDGKLMMVAAVAKMTFDQTRTFKLSLSSASKWSTSFERSRLFESQPVLLKLYIIMCTAALTYDKRRNERR